MGEPTEPLTVVYDAECALCRSAARRLGKLDTRGRLALVPFQDLTSRSDEFGGPRLGELAGALHVLRPDGSTVSGGKAVLEVASTVPRLRPIAALGRLPILNRLVEPLYRLISRHRHRLSQLI